LESIRRCIIPGPYDKFEIAFEEFQTQLKEELEIFRQQLLQEIHQQTTFDPMVFRQELLQDIEKKFAEFREELSVSLESRNVLPYPHGEELPPPEQYKKQSWLDKKLF
jgi:hypothetical protein